MRIIRNIKYVYPGLIYLTAFLAYFVFYLYNNFHEDYKYIMQSSHVGIVTSSSDNSTVVTCDNGLKLLIDGNYDLNTSLRVQTDRQEVTIYSFYWAFMYLKPIIQVLIGIIVFFNTIAIIVLWSNNYKLTLWRRKH